MESRGQRRPWELARFAYAHAADAMHVVGPGARLLEVNEASCRLFGYTRDELLARTVADIDLDHSLDRWPEHWAELRERGVLAFQSRGLHRDGTVFPIHVTTQIFVHQGEELICAVIRDLRQKRRVEDLLRESEARFRALFEQSNEGILRTNWTGEVLGANDALAAIVGARSGRELVGTNVERFYDTRTQRRALLDANGEADSLRTEVTWRRRGGERIRVELSGRKEVAHDGTITFTTFVRDVTSARRREALLEAVSTDLGVSHGVALVAQLGARLVRVLGSDVQGLAIVRGLRGRRRLLHAWVEGQEVSLPPWPQGDEAAASMEASLAHALGILDGTHHVVAIRDPDGSTVGLFVALGVRTLRAREWTREALEVFAQRVGAEIARARVEERSTAVFEHAPNAVVITDQRGTIVNANRLAEVLFERPRLALIGEPLDAHVSRSGEDGELARARRSDGVEVPLEINEAPFRADDEDLVVVALRDVSERVVRDEERRRLETELRSRQRLESLGTLAGGIAHDFNNLLAAIVANAELAAGSPEHSAGALDEIRAVATRGRELVARILAFGRRQRATRQVALLGPVVAEVGRLLRATLPTNIELALEIPDTDVAAEIDPTQIHQVVLNLATNASHAIGHASGHLRIALDVVDGTDESGRPTSQARIRVADDGCGMSEEVIERAFEPFFTTKRVGEGTGLGLSVAHGIVVDHGGELRVTSEVGLGSELTVLLPRVAAPTVRCETPSMPAPPAHSIRVLLVDDEDSLARPLVRLLRQRGFRAETYSRALDALAAFRDAPNAFDVVITDLHMPELDGLELLRRIRAVRPGIAAVLVSGNHQLHANEGADAVLLDKPFRPAELLAAVHQALETSQAAS
jgi:PAS domain S-box-containing protein